MVNYKRQGADDSLYLPRPFPPHVPLEWPLTRAARIGELEGLAPFNKPNAQKHNTIAAKAHHVQFPPEELALDERAIFSSGKINGSKMRLSEGLTWWEVWSDLVIVTDH